MMKYTETWSLPKSDSSPKLPWFVSHRLDPEWVLADLELRNSERALWLLPNPSWWPAEHLSPVSDRWRHTRNSSLFPNIEMLSEQSLDNYLHLCRHKPRSHPADWVGWPNLGPLLDPRPLPEKFFRLELSFSFLLMFFFLKIGKDHHHDHLSVQALHRGRSKGAKESHQNGKPYSYEQRCHVEGKNNHGI